MADRITELVEHAVGSPWVYLALFAFAALDAFFPIVPSESLVISAGVFAASGTEPEDRADHPRRGRGRVRRRPHLVLHRPDRRREADGAGQGGLEEAAGLQTGAQADRGTRRHDPRRLPLHPGRADRDHAHGRRRPLRAAQVLLLRRHRRALVGDLLDDGRLHRRRGLRGGSAQGPRPRARHRPRRLGADRGHPSPRAPARVAALEPPAGRSAAGRVTPSAATRGSPTRRSRRASRPSRRASGRC